MAQSGALPSPYPNVVTDGYLTQYDANLYAQYLQFVSGGSAGVTIQGTTQTTNFTAGNNLGYPVSTTANPVTMTLPSNPGDQIRCGAWIVAYTNTFTFVTSGIDTFEDGTTSTTRNTGIGQATLWQYVQATHKWYPMTDDIPLSLFQAMALTLTNKRVVTRTLALAFAAQPTYNTDLYDVIAISNISGAITSMTVNATGTPNVNEIKEFTLTDNGTAQTIAWGANYASNIATLPSSTVPGTFLRVTFQYSTVSGKWECIGAFSGILTISANSATPSVNVDVYHALEITGQTTAITGLTIVGTPVQGQPLRVAITGTGSVAIALGASFEPSTVPLPTTTVGTARLDAVFIWNSATSKFRCVGVA
jgi:hypothetical protein